MKDPGLYRIRCTYFKKENGKYYTHAEEVYESEIFIGCLYPKDFGHRLMGLGRLPGFPVGHAWQGYILVEIPSANNSYPELITP